MSIYYRIATLNDIEKMSKQLNESYVSVYENLMSEEYLSSLPANHWIPYWKKVFKKEITALLLNKKVKLWGLVYLELSMKKKGVQIGTHFICCQSILVMV